MGLEKPNSGLEPGETNSGSDLDSDETFQISRNLGLDIDEIVCLLDSQLCLIPTRFLNPIDCLKIPALYGTSTYLLSLSETGSAEPYRTRHDS